MRAMVLSKIKTPLKLQELEIPTPSIDQILIKIVTCGVCRTDLHVVDGDLPSPKLPLIPGHQIVGYVAATGQNVSGIEKGMRIGVPWLGGSCGTCGYCIEGRENLCDKAQYTGYQINGGFAEYCVADARFVFPLPEDYSDIQVAPLLCAGIIGYRALSMTEGAKKIGFYGFGSSAHILIQVVLHQGGEVFAFTREGDKETQKFAKTLGATWAGAADEYPPSQLDAAIIFAPAGSLVPLALRAVKKGGIVVCAGIHMSDIPSFPYSILWEERVLKSVANLTRRDGREFLKTVSQVPIQTQVRTYPLENTNEALDDLRKGKFEGSAVILI